MNTADMSLPMPAHDNERFGLQVGNQNPTSDRGLSAGKNVGKRHGKACGDMKNKEAGY